MTTCSSSAHSLLRVMVSSVRFSSKLPTPNMHILIPHCTCAGNDNHPLTTSVRHIWFQEVVTSGQKCTAELGMPIIPFKSQTWHLNGDVLALDETFWNQWVCKGMTANFLQWVWPQRHYPLPNDRGFLLGGSTWEHSRRWSVRNTVASFMYLNVSNLFQIFSIPISRTCH